MTKDQATGRNQTGPQPWFRLRFSALSVAITASGIALAAGCADRSSPAATMSNASQTASAENTSASSDGAARKSVDSTASSSPASSAASDSPTSPAEAAAQLRQQPARDITFDTIKFDMQKDEPFQRKMITPAIEKIHNTKIRIRGYILPSFQQTGLAQFVLVRDNMQCCFGPGAALYDCIVVQMDVGQTTDFTTRPVAVEGVFSIQEIAGPEGKCLAIYHLQADKVE